MLIKCPACKREFAEPGFCPYDGAQLVAVDGRGSPAERETVLSAQRPAESSRPPTDAPDSSPTEVERFRTRPLTPSVHGPKSASQPISFTAVRAVSAAVNTDAAIRAMRIPSEYDRMVGETLDGRYFVQRKIGEGGMGVVFAVRHAVIERPLAVKVLKREVMRDAGTIRRFVQEARAASRIGHPNIVDVTDFGTTPEGLTYQVMEFIDGETLGHAIRIAAPFPLVRVIRIAAQIARALGVAHDKGIVHRDLKPENVFLLDRDGRPDFVKIVDFGIAKVAPLPGTVDQLAPRLTKVGSVFGTPEYMAPEQAQGRGDTDGRVDVYALGTIVYEMLTGQVPHKGDTTVRTLAMQMLDPVIPPSQLRPDLQIARDAETIVMKALAKKREDRYQTMTELVAALEQLTRDALPPPIGQSLTGNPVYALPALPPGADASAIAQLAGGVPSSPISEPPRQLEAPPMNAAAGATTGTSPTRRRVSDEPQFVSDAKPLTFEHVDRDRDRDRTVGPATRRSPVLAILFVLLVVGGAGAATYYFALRDRGDDGARNAGSGSAGSSDSHARDAAQVATTSADAAVLVATASPDAAAIPPAPTADADAGAVVAAAADAAVITSPPPDAAVAVALVVTDAGAGRTSIPPHRRRDAGTSGPVTMPHTGDATIMVQTSSEAAHIYVGTTYRGENGTTLSEPYGTRETVECRAPGFKPGHVTLVFDGNIGAVYCKMQRVKICINNIKNPFDDCEIDPTRPSPDTTMP